MDTNSLIEADAAAGEDPAQQRAGCGYRAVRTLASINVASFFSTVETAGPNAATRHPSARPSVRPSVRPPIDEGGAARTMLP